MESEQRSSSKLSADDMIVVLFGAFGFVGAVGLVVFARVPPILSSFLLATGVAAFVYRFLGGLHGATFTIGALKLTGTIAALVGIALTVNHYLDDQLRYRPLTEDDIVGEWNWDYGEGGWTGHLTFTKQDGQLHFVGQEDKCIDHECKPIYDLTNGTASLDRKSVV